MIIIKSPYYISTWELAGLFHLSLKCQSINTFKEKDMFWYTRNMYYPLGQRQGLNLYGKNDRYLINGSQ